MFRKTTLFDFHNLVFNYFRRVAQYALYVLYLVIQMSARVPINVNQLCLCFQVIAQCEPSDKLINGTCMTLCLTQRV